MLSVTHHGRSSIGVSNSAYLPGGGKQSLSVAVLQRYCDIVDRMLFFLTKIHPEFMSRLVKNFDYIPMREMASLCPGLWLGCFSIKPK